MQDPFYSVRGHQGEWDIICNKGEKLIRDEVQELYGMPIFFWTSIRGSLNIQIKGAERCTSQEHAYTNSWKDFKALKVVMRSSKPFRVYSFPLKKS